MGITFSIMYSKTKNDEGCDDFGCNFYRMNDERTDYSV